MTNTAMLPNGEEKIMVELTVKEAIALTGYKFLEQRELLPSARKKLRESVTNKVLQQ